MGMGLIFGSSIQKSERKSVKELVEAEGGSIASEEKPGEKDEYLNNETVVNYLFDLGICEWNAKNPNKMLSFKEVENVLLEEYGDEGYSLLLDFFNGANCSSVLLGLNEISIAENISNILHLSLPLVYLADKILENRRLNDTINWIMSNKETTEKKGVPI